MIRELSAISPSVSYNSLITHQGQVLDDCRLVFKLSTEFTFGSRNEVSIVFSYFKKLIKVQRFQSNNSSLPYFTLAKLRLAGHPQARPAALSRLAKSKEEQVLVRVAENTNTPQDVLCDMALSELADVRAAVADNPNTPPRALFLLAMDVDLDVRYSIAENHNAPPAVLQLLTQDENPYVSCRAASTLQRAGDFPNLVGGDHLWSGAQERFRRSGMG